MFIETSRTYIPAHLCATERTLRPLEIASRNRDLCKHRESSFKIARPVQYHRRRSCGRLSEE